jgi:hypothetical protein
MNISARNGKRKRRQADQAAPQLAFADFFLIGGDDRDHRFKDTPLIRFWQDRRKANGLK